MYFRNLRPKYENIDTTGGLIAKERMWGPTDMKSYLYSLRKVGQLHVSQLLRQVHAFDRGDSSGRRRGYARLSTNRFKKLSTLTMIANEFLGQ